MERAWPGDAWEGAQRVRDGDGARAPDLKEHGHARSARGWIRDLAAEPPEGGRLSGARVTEYHRVSSFEQDVQLAQHRTSLLELSGQRPEVQIDRRGFCVDAADYDGENLTPEKVEKLFERLTKDYVADRHENP